jgi:hypothetical protein
MTKSAGSKTFPLTNSNTERSIFGRSGSIKSKMNFDDPSLPWCIIPIVEIEPSQEIALRQAGSLENERGSGVEPLKEPRVEDHARGVTIAPLDLPLPSRNDHRLSSTHTSRPAPRQRRPPSQALLPDHRP